MSEHLYRCVICGVTKTITVGKFAFYAIPHCKRCVTSMHLVLVGAQPYRIDEPEYE
jgi:hypothetical protein